MPLDPSVLLKVQYPQYPDPVEDYKGFLSLRQMMDLGKLRQVQLQQTQLENQQKQQALDDARRLREALAGGIPEDAPLSTYLQRFGEEGVKIYGAIRQAKSAESTRQTAELTRQEKAADLTRKRGQSLADLGTATLQLPADQQQAYWDDAWGLPVDKPPTAQEVQAQIAQSYGTKEAQAIANAAADAAQKALLRPLELRQKTAEALTAEAKPTQEALRTTDLQDVRAGRLLGFVADQPSLSTWYNSLPAEQRARIGPPPTYNDATIKRLNRMFMTAEQRVQADERANKLLTPEEEAQQIRIARAKSEAIREGKPPTQGEELLAGYAARVKQANKGFERVTMGTGEMAWNRFAPNLLKTEAGQTFAQDERNFINAILRRESGAVISPSEFAEARAQYIPQPGDSAAVLEKKRQNRLLVQQNLIRGAGRAYVDPDQLLREAGVDVPTLNPATKTAQPIPNPIIEVKRGPDGKLR